MNKSEHLLACIGEECGEIQQLVGKALRFGMKDANPETNEINYDALIREFNDLAAVFEMGYGKSIFELLDGDLMAKKKIKVVRYMDYAKERNKLEEE